MTTVVVIPVPHLTRDVPKLSLVIGLPIVPETNQISPELLSYKTLLGGELTPEWGIFATTLKELFPSDFPFAGKSGENPLPQGYRYRAGRAFSLNDWNEITVYVEKKITFLQELINTRKKLVDSQPTITITYYSL